MSGGWGGFKMKRDSTDENSTRQPKVKKTFNSF